MPVLGISFMNTIGVALIVGGMAFLFSGLIFLLPIERKVSDTNGSINVDQERIEYYLRQIREDRSRPQR
jgi:hypothetical protein